MNRKTKLVLTIVFYFGVGIQGIFCQNSVTPKPEITTPLKTSASRQTPKKHFPTELLEYFKGDWSGTGKFAASGKDVYSDFSFVADSDNQTLIVHEKERAPHTYHFIALWSINSADGNLVMLFANDSGAELFRSESGSWQNGKIVFQSAPELKAPFAFERFTFERKSDASFVTTYEMSRDGKNWRTGDTQTFTRKQ